jgi:hypothetical protein
MNLVEISSAEPGEIPFSKSTCYKFHSLKRYPKLIFKVGNKLFLSMDEWAKMAQEAQRESENQAARIHKTLGE